MALILILVGALCATIGYFAGHSHGYELGREHELDKAAQRHERMKRFSQFP
jgi:hydrogenase/urease accessory protein HupE